MYETWVTEIIFRRYWDSLLPYTHYQCQMITSNANRLTYLGKLRRDCGLAGVACFFLCEVCCRDLTNRANSLGWRGVGVVIGRIPGMRRQVRQIFYC